MTLTLFVEQNADQALNATDLMASIAARWQDEYGPVKRPGSLRIVCPALERGTFAPLKGRTFECYAGLVRQGMNLVGSVPDYYPAAYQARVEGDGFVVTSLGACYGPGFAHCPPLEWTLTTAGLGPVAAGASAGHTGLKPDGGSRAGGCEYFVMPGLQGAKFMVIDGEVTRTEVFRADIETLSGVQVGDSEATVHEVYSEVVVRPIEGESGAELMFLPEDRWDQMRMLFYIDGSRVQEIHAGPARFIMRPGCDEPQSEAGSSSNR